MKNFLASCVVFVDQAKRRAGHFGFSAAQESFGDPLNKSRFSRAKRAFQKALLEIDQYLAACPDSQATVAPEVSRIKGLIYECNKSSPQLK